MNSNPWKEIPLTDYENHMKHDSVMQLQAINKLMKGQLDSYPINNVMILGIAGGNGLEHIQKDKFKKVYCIDINNLYLQEVILRYPNLNEIMECLCADLTSENSVLPKTDMVIANLIIEYIGYDCFKKTILYTDPKYVSCIIQINTKDSWVSGSPYQAVFKPLEQVHNQIEEEPLTNSMAEIGYNKINRLEYPLPNGKKLVQTDFERQKKANE